MMTQQTPFVRRQVRKLLMFICGNKDKYRQLRDLHSLATHVKVVENNVNFLVWFPMAWKENKLHLNVFFLGCYAVCG